MGLFDKLLPTPQARIPQRAPQMGMQQTPQQVIDQIKHDPTATLAQAGIDIPKGMTDAEQVLNHMLNGNQLKPGVRQAAMRMLGRR